MSPTDTVLVDRDGPVATVTLNRPERLNALTIDMFAEITASVRGLDADPDVRAIVLTGAGRGFCSGADLEGARNTHPMRRMEIINETARTVAGCTTPIVAKVRGHAVGAGWNLALLCDVVAAAPEAKFCQIFARRGLSVDFGGSWILPRVVGVQQAKRLTLLAETVDAAEAHRLGAVTWVVDDAELDGFVADVAGRLADGPPVALAQSKRLIDNGSGQSLHEALAAEAAAVAVNFATDAPEAVRAFVDKRTPEFHGTWAVQ